MKGYPFISVIVPVLNRENDIGRCLNSLLTLDYSSFEIIVVDNGSTDKTQEIVSRFPAKMFVENKRGAYIARNTGLKHATGEIIAFTDSDCVAHRDWLKNLIKNYTNEKVGGVGGHLLPYNPTNIIEEFLSFGPLRIFHSSETVVMKRQPNQFLSGALGSANMSYRKEVLEEVGGFCKHFATFCGAYDLCWRIQKAGYNVIYEPKALVYHKLRSSLFQLIKQFFLFGKCQTQLLKKQPERFSYIKIKTYLFPTYEFRCKLPMQMLITIDFCNLFILGIILIFVYPIFLYLSLVILLVILSGTWLTTKVALKKSGKLKWLLLFPLLHLFRNYAFMTGRIIGGIKYRVLSI